ncbi:AAA family ATPase [Pseudorhodoplanes sinuspersici]|uniref:ATPase n=1 Tax=Pseudorhodoplanes sinuspersici TaxID=1235591 RepID=A0A1W6ZU38_9HYPH|nr:AAA family ATPase [Pseudorhodoplanes sinuspersici]ARQ00823.1 ATPase [Pseudorhodoplanes sinuspersici]RKE72441.1 putative ATPase [Pseudorhodoplanes sinuspersici]
MRDVERFFVITGGPGSGKTTLVEALAAAGFARTAEAGRAVIQEQLANGGGALPWKDRAAFAEKMLERDIQSYKATIAQTGPVFFDRGIPDVVGYLRLCGLPVPVHLMKAATDFRYHRRVFIAPPWREIYAQDAERKQDFDEAQRTYDAMVEIYSKLDYELVILPRMNVEERVRFVVDAIARQGHRQH